MDIYCLNCGEPWDVCEPKPYGEGFRFELNPGGETVNRSKLVGCPCCRQNGKAASILQQRLKLVGVAADLSRDDIDGLAADLEDLGVMEGAWD